MQRRRSQRLRRPAQLLAFLFLGVFLSACSSTSFVYNRLDFFLPWYLDDYVELNREQERYLDELLQPFLEWHRTEELPVYIELLNRVSAKRQSPVGAAEVEGWVDVGRAAIYRLESRAVDWMLLLGEQLSEEQLVEFVDALRRENAKFEKKLLDRTEQEFVEDTYDSMRKHTTTYLGRLSKEQKKRLLDASERMQRVDRYWLADQKAWVEKLAVLLQREPGWQERIRDAVVARRNPSSKNYDAALKHNTALIRNVVVALLNDLSERQARHLDKALADLRGDLIEIVGEDGETKSLGTTALAPSDSVSPL